VVTAADVVGLLLGCLDTLAEGEAVGEVVAGAETEGVTDTEIECDWLLDSLVEADFDVDDDDDGLLEIVSEALSEHETLGLGVPSDEEDTDALGDSLLDGV